MNFIIKHGITKSILALWLLIIIRPSNLQIAVPIYPPPVYAMPIAMPIPMMPHPPWSGRLPSPEPITTTCAPPYRSPMFPRPGFGVPVAPIVAPPPVVIVPLPPQPPRCIRPPRRPPLPDISGSSSCSSSSSSSSECDRRRSRLDMRRKGIRRRLNRRNLDVGEAEFKDNEIVKPMLSYISRDGDVKYNRRLSRYEADQLIGENKNTNSRRQQQTVHVISESEPENSRLVVVSHNGDNAYSDDHKRKQVVMRKGGVKHVLGEGKKQIIFKPPADKTITNLSVSFQIV